MELHRAEDKFLTEIDHLERVMMGLDREDPSQVALALSQAKRVRTASNLLVRALAQTRDQLQP